MSTLLFADGFGHYIASEIGLKWDSASVGGVFVAGRYSYSIGLTGQAIKTLKDLTETALTETTLTVGFNWTEAAGSYSNLPISIQGTNFVAEIINNGDNTLSAQITYNATPVTKVSTRTTFAMVPGNWNYYEFQFIINNSAHTVGASLKVDGTYVIESFGFTIDTGTYYFTQVVCDSRNGVVADLYVTDNLFLDPLRIVVINPASDGDTLTLTPLSGSTHYIEVDDIPPDGDTSYNYAQGASGEDLYHNTTISTFPVPAVLGIQVCSFVENIDLDNTYVWTAIKTAYDTPLSLPATETDFPTSGNLTLDTSPYRFVLCPILNNPTSSDNWVMYQISEMQTGFKVSPNGGSVVVPSGTVQLAVGFNCNTSYAQDDTIYGNWGLDTIGSFTIAVTGPATAGGNITITKEITPIFTPGASGSYENGFDYQGPWYTFSGQSTLTDGHGGNLSQYGTGNANCPPTVFTTADGLRLQAGDTLTWTATGGVAMNNQFGLSRSNPPYAAPAYAVPGGFPGNLCTDECPCGFCASPSGTVCFNSAGGFQYGFGSCTNSGNYLPCIFFGGNLGVLGLIGNFQGANQLTADSIPVPGSGVVIGSPFAIGVGGTGIVP